VMEALLIHLLIWGQAQGPTGGFALGMAPLAGRWTTRAHRTGTASGHSSTRHGESVYKFQGLRAFKEKFHPVWEPRYLGVPGAGLKLPLILADVSALIGGRLSPGIPEITGPPPAPQRAAIRPVEDGAPRHGPRRV